VVQVFRAVVYLQQDRKKQSEGRGTIRGTQ
jgi:hypothetical protein